MRKRYEVKARGIPCFTLSCSEMDLENASGEGWGSPAARELVSIEVGGMLS